MTITNFPLLQMKNGKSNEKDLTDFGIYMALDLEIELWSVRVDPSESVQRSSKLQRTQSWYSFWIIFVKLYYSNISPGVVTNSFPFHY